MLISSRWREWHKTSAEFGISNHFSQKKYRRWGENNCLSFIFPFPLHRSQKMSWPSLEMLRWTVQTTSVKSYEWCVLTTKAVHIKSYSPVQIRGMFSSQAKLLVSNSRSVAMITVILRIPLAWASISGYLNTIPHQFWASQRMPRPIQPLTDWQARIAYLCQKFMKYGFLVVAEQIGRSKSLAYGLCLHGPKPRALPCATQQQRQNNINAYDVKSHGHKDCISLLAEK